MYVREKYEINVEPTFLPYKIRPHIWSIVHYLSYSRKMQEACNSHPLSLAPHFSKQQQKSTRKKNNEPIGMSCAMHNSVV